MSEDLVKGSIDVVSEDRGSVARDVYIEIDEGGEERGGH